MFQLVIKEIKDLYSGWSTWLVLMVLIIVNGLVLWVFPGSSYLTYGYASPELFFEYLSYLLLFFIPAITYGMFSQESKNGTLEFLRSLPISNLEIVGSKYLASMTVLLFILLTGIPTLYVLNDLSMGNGHLEWSQVIGSFAGIFMLCGFFISVGLLASVLFDNAALSFITAVITGYFFFEGWHVIGQVSDYYGGWDLVFQKLTIRYHADYLSKGILSLSGIVYIATLQLLFLFFCELKLSKTQNG